MAVDSTWARGFAGFSELVGHERVRVFRDAFRFSDVPLRVVGVDVRARRDDFCAERAHHVELFGRRRFGNDDDASIAAHGAHHREADAGVSAARFDDGLSGANRTAFFSVFDHGERRAIFHASTRREELELHDDVGCAPSGTRRRSFTIGVRPIVSSTSLQIASPTVRALYCNRAHISCGMNRRDAALRMAARSVRCKHRNTSKKEARLSCDNFADPFERLLRQTIKALAQALL